MPAAKKKPAAPATPKKRPAQSRKPGMPAPLKGPTPAAVPAESLSAAQARARAFYADNQSKKALERDVEGHRKYFLELAGAVRPFVVDAGDVVVTVDDRESDRLDRDELAKVVTPDVIAACTKPSTCTQVSVREKKDEAA